MKSTGNITKMFYACCEHCQHNIRHNHVWRYHAKMLNMHSELPTHTHNTHTQCSAGITSVAAAEVFHYVVPIKPGSKMEVTQLPRVPICSHCWVHCVSLQSDACDFPPDTTANGLSTFTTRMDLHWYNSMGAWPVTGTHKGHNYMQIYGLWTLMSTNVMGIIQQKQQENWTHFCATSIKKRDYLLSLTVCVLNTAKSWCYTAQ